MILSSLTAFSQKNRYVVYFTDKDNNPYSIDAPEEFLSQRAIFRRDKFGIPVVQEDLPVNPHYIDSLQKKGIEIHFTSRWFNLVLIEATAEEVALADDISIVDTIIYVAPGEKLRSSRIKMNYDILNATEQQNTFHNIDVMHQNNLKGEGVWVAVMDGGFTGVNTVNGFQHIYDNNRLILAKNYVENDSNVYQYSSHGTKVLSLISAYIEGEYISGAPDATIGLFVTEDVSSEYRIEEYNWLFAAETADSAGFDIINTSLGYSTFDDPLMSYEYKDMDGLTTIISRASNMATARGILTITSAGNEGNGTWKYITAPADAFGNISVGAVDFNGNKAAFSSVGPSADGRIKPEIAAVGVGVAVISSTGSITTGSGTSFAAPIATSMMAGIIQQFPDLTILGLRSLAFEWASQTNSPNNLLGYGVLKYGGAEDVTDVQQDITFLPVYPNPTNKFLSLGNIIPEKVQVWDIRGKLIPIEVLGTNKIDVSSLQPGVYLLSAIVKNKLFITKFVKE